jgi:hypothetical protein
MIGTFARITAPDFMVGIILWNDKVVQVSAKIDYMRGWSERRVLAHCARKGYWVETIGRERKPRPQYTRRRANAMQRTFFRSRLARRNAHFLHRERLVTGLRMCSMATGTAPTGAGCRRSSCTLTPTSA